ncbi:hypothetical protein [Haloarcula laminariae]|uniref:hypothetical protein n=1 Tax=Haloarcula laminariae TaxID=2961577 RepID=UPI0021C5E153|nr:hypothetical protein [Halomicroarcula laminariae]
MQYTEPYAKEGTDSGPIEEIIQVQSNAHEAGHVTCQACAQPLPDGTEVTAYAVRPGRHAPWMVAQTRCVDHPLTLSNQTTLGVDERLLTGRLARIVDQAHQRSWPITIAETVVATSPAETTDTQEAQA